MAPNNPDSTVLTVLQKRPLPSFDQWLTDHGNGKRGDGFEAFVELAKRTHATTPPPGLTEDENAFLRFWMGMQVAITELCNIEYQKGRDNTATLITMARVLGAAAVYSTASVVKDDAPMRQLAKILIEEFRFAAKQAADQLEAEREVAHGG